LVHSNPFELLAATILSAQCTDRMVNQVTPELFRHYPDAAALAAADPGQLERIIHRTGFYRSKARSLIGMARGLVERHGGQVPADLEALTALPGVGRKTAQVVLGVAFRKPTGIVVDTHVKRLAYRMGLSDETDPVKVERDLMAALPRKEWIDFSHRMIAHGRAVCTARSPRCDGCPVGEVCLRRGVRPPGPLRRSAGAGQRRG
jgi:endonuclease-3